MSDAQIYDLYAQKISDITNIPYPYIIALRDNGLLNQKEARDKLIRHDYWKLMKTTNSHITRYLKNFLVYMMSINVKFYMR